MGCWDETCVVTNLPIRHGEPCVMVLIKANMVRDKPMDIDDFRHVESISKGKYNDYGWIDSLDMKEKWQDIRSTKHRVFFHRNAWDSIIKFMKKEKKKIDSFYDDLVLLSKASAFLKGEPKFLAWEKDMKDFVAVSFFCRDARRSLYIGGAFAGYQDDGDRKNHCFIANLILQNCKT